MEIPSFEHSEREHVLQHPKVLEYLERKKIKFEDYGLVLRLAAFDKNMLIESLHNLFNLHHEKSGKELELCINLARTPEKKALYQAALEFYNVYGWAASYALVRVLEKI